MLNILFKSHTAFVKYNGMFSSRFSFFQHLTRLGTQSPYHFLSAADVGDLSSRSKCDLGQGMWAPRIWSHYREFCCHGLPPSCTWTSLPAMILQKIIAFKYSSLLRPPCQGHIHLFADVPCTHIRGLHRIFKDLS
jgi:hypothetical protein